MEPMAFDQNNSADLSLSQDVGNQVFGRCPSKFVIYTMNETHKQYNLLDTILTILSFMLDLQENIYKQVKKTYYMSAGSAGRHVVGVEDLSIGVFLEVRNKRYS